MKTRCLITLLVLCNCRAQTPMKAPGAAESEMESDLRGTFDRTQKQGEAAVFHDVPEGSARPSGTSISVERLRHKVPKEAWKSFSRASRFSKNGDHAGAVAELQMAIRYDPRFTDAYNLLGAEYGQMGRIEEAAATLRQSIKLDPHSSVAHCGLALARFQLGDLTGAELSARRALEESPENAVAHFLLDYMLYEHDGARADGLKHLVYAARTLPEAQKFLRNLQPQ